jgi:hypothetical protein
VDEAEATADLLGEAALGQQFQIPTNGRHWQRLNPSSAVVARYGVKFNPDESSQLGLSR